MNGVAFVTGGSRGIGRAIALRLGKMGYAVAVGYHAEERQALDVVEQLCSMGCNAQAFCCDVSDSAQVTMTANAIKDCLGDVTVLVNNAGIAEQKLFTDISDDDWNRMIGVHLTGTFYTCRTFLPSMIHKKQGVIVNISSMWGQVGGSCEVHYSAAKGGIIALTKALAKEVGPSGVRVNCVAPGVISTDMLSELTKETLQELVNETPLTRLGTPQDVANAVAFLVSPDASFITGQILAPNGGMII